MAITVVRVVVSVVVMSIVMVVTIYSHNRMVMIAVMAVFLNNRTVMMVPVMTLGHAHTYAAGTDVHVLGDRSGRKCECKTENQSEWR